MSYKIVAIGEVLWDLLPNGAKPGGAPANFAYHAQGLGAVSTLISAVGTDLRGKELLTFFESIGLSTQFVQCLDNVPTGTVGVQVSESGVPTFSIHENVAWDYITFSEDIVDILKKADILCFGSLASRCDVSRNTIQKMLKHCPEKTLRVLDLNLRPPFYSPEIILQLLDSANVLKLNEDELVRIAEIFDIPGAGLEEQAKWLLEKYKYHLVIVTRGPCGSLLLSGDEISDYPGFSLERSMIVDTVGAGDAFTAAAILGFLHSWPLAQINERANAYAAYVCTQQGATPVVPEKFRMF